jgi:hypothetical protein
MDKVFDLPSRRFGAASKASDQSEKPNSLDRQGFRHIRLRRLGSSAAALMPRADTIHVSAT